MPEGAATWGILAAVALFVAWVLLKSRFSLSGRDPNRVEARKKLAAIKQRARAAKGDAARQARAWREASEVALAELERPNLAASYARRADRLDPGSGESLRVIAEAMRSAHRYRALEKLLWRRLDESEADSERARRAMQELLTLYEGPMRRPAQARVLRRLFDLGGE